MPDQSLLPAHLLNQFSYCPRLFYYQFVDGLFVETADTIEGALQHQPQDHPGHRTVETDLGPALQTRALHLTSESLRLTARLDLLEEAGGWNEPIEYKHGSPPDQPGDRTLHGAWRNDAIQLGAQMLLLEVNGMPCRQGRVYYRETKQTITIPWNDALRVLVTNHLEAAWAVAGHDETPAPLAGDPRCPGCALVGICMPEETYHLKTRGPVEAPDGLRRIIPGRDDEGVLYVTTQGATLGKTGQVLTIKERGSTLAEVPMARVRQICLLGGVQITSQAVAAVVDAGIPIIYMSLGGRFHGMTTGLPAKNVRLRQRQYERLANPQHALALARKTVAAKIANQRVLLLRNHKDGAGLATDRMKDLLTATESAASMEELLGLEGSAARHYFEQFGGMLRDAAFTFDGRNRRPPRDPVNALLSFGYALLVKDLTVAAFVVGLDPYCGYFHQPRHGRPALALDLMEEFRPLIVDSVVLTLINKQMVTPADFLVTPGGCLLTQQGRKRFLDAYEQRKETLITHPLFGYRMSYTRMFEAQARLLARVLEDELPEYVGFVTR